MKWFALCLALAASGAQAQDNQKMIDYMNCLAKEVREADDGVSDATTVGRSISAACPQQFDAFVRSMGRDNDPAYESVLREHARELKLDMATRVVLTVRAAERRKAKATSQ